MLVTQGADKKQPGLKRNESAGIGQMGRGKIFLDPL